MALQHQLSLVASEKDDADVTENARMAMTGDASPGSVRLRSRTVTSRGSIKSTDDRATAAEKKPLMANQLIKDEDVVEGSVCYTLLILDSVFTCITHTLNKKDLLI